MQYKVNYAVVGEYRIKSGFLFFIKGIDGEYKWLEYGYWIEGCVFSDKFFGVRWDALCWIKESEKDENPYKVANRYFNVL